MPAERQFVDDGVSGATQVRPALDRLRDLAAVGAIDRIYVHSPDRLARNYAYQVLLLDGWRRANVELVFLNGSLGQSPEDEIQAEYLEAAVWREVCDFLKNPEELERDFKESNNTVASLQAAEALKAQRLKPHKQEGRSALLP